MATKRKSTKQKAQKALLSKLRADKKLAQESYKRLCKRIAELHLRSERNTIVSRHEIGAELVKVAEKSGDRIIGNVARDLSLDRSTLYDAVSVARKWETAAALKAFLDKHPNEKGTQFTWSHLIELASIKKAALFDQAVTIARKNSMTVRDLRQWLADRGAAKDTTSLFDPNSPRGFVRFVTRTASRAEDLRRSLAAETKQIVDHKAALDADGAKALAASVASHLNLRQEVEAFINSAKSKLGSHPTGQRLLDKPTPPAAKAV